MLHDVHFAPPPVVALTYNYAHCGTWIFLQVRVVYRIPSSTPYDPNLLVWYRRTSGRHIWLFALLRGGLTMI